MAKSKDYADLAELVNDPGDSQSTVKIHKFFLEAAGHKTPMSFRIVNECLTMFYINYKKLPQETDTAFNFGNEYEPSVTKKHLNTLLGMFKSNGVPYILNDFKGKGGVASLAEETWGIVHGVRPEFGCSTNRSKVDPTLQTKLHENACPVIQPYSCYKDLICILRVLLGLRLLYRGCKEVADLKWSNIKDYTCRDGDNFVGRTGFEFCGVLRKANQLRFDNVSLQNTAFAIQMMNYAWLA